jgi:hypothetical protein
MFPDLILCKNRAESLPGSPVTFSEKSFLSGHTVALPVQALHLIPLKYASIL